MSSDVVLQIPTMLVMSTTQSVTTTTSATTVVGIDSDKNNAGSQKERHRGTIAAKEGFSSIGRFGKK